VWSTASSAPLPSSANLGFAVPTVLNGTLETTANWIAVDWGTTNLRAWSLTPDGTVLCAASSAQGMSKLARTEFEPALLELVESWLPQTGATIVIACGMVGARQGWVEAPTKRHRALRLSLIGLFILLHAIGASRLRYYLV
jgi:hypothetical protein